MQIPLLCRQAWHAHLPQRVGDFMPWLPNASHAPLMWIACSSCRRDPCQLRPLFQRHALCIIIPIISSCTIGPISAWYSLYLTYKFIFQTLQVSLLHLDEFFWARALWQAPRVVALSELSSRGPIGKLLHHKKFPLASILKHSSPLNDFIVITRKKYY